MQTSEQSLAQTKYILSVVDEEIARLETERKELIQNWIENQWHPLDQNLGATLALHRLRGRLSVMVEIQLDNLHSKRIK